MKAINIKFMGPEIRSIIQSLNRELKYYKKYYPEGIGSHRHIERTIRKFKKSLLNYQKLNLTKSP
jgi:hypothetical protein